MTPTATSTHELAARGAAGSGLLDASQRAVLERAEGSFSVIGAPGTGKTTTLVELVADRVGSGRVPVDRALVLSPTRDGAGRLRDRLALRLGMVTTGPIARTPASLAFALVRAAASRDGRGAPLLLTGAEHDSLIAEVLEGHLSGDVRGPKWPESLPAAVRATRQFRDELRELAMRATELGISTARLGEIGRASGRPEWASAASLLAELGEVADQVDARRLDSAQLIAEARRALVASDVAPYDLVVADDLHEFDTGALRLLATLARRGADVVAFGDPDVSTKTFRGARGESLGQFGALLGERVGPPSVLAVVHRHGAGIREVVSRVLERVGSSAAGVQREAGCAPTAEGSRVDVAIASSPSDECDRIASALRERHLLDGVPYREMAVIVRSNATAERIRRGLDRHEIASSSASRGTTLVHLATPRALLVAIAVATGARDADASTLTELLGSPLSGVDALGLRRLRLALRHEELAGGGVRAADELLVEAFSGPGRFDSLEVPVARQAGRLARLLARLRRAAEDGGSIEELLWLAWSSGSLSERLRTQSAGSGPEARRAHLELDAVVALFDSAKRHVERDPGDVPIGFLWRALSAEVVQDTLGARSSADSVVIATPSAVVGREFDTVVVAGLQEGAWPNLRLRGTLLAAHLLDDDGAAEADPPRQARAEVLADELRMFGLALSRARRRVLVTSIEDEDTRPSPFLRLVDPDFEPGSAAGSTASHPLSLRGLVGELRARVVQRADEEAAQALARLRLAGVPGADPRSWYGIAELTGRNELVDLTLDEACVSVSPSHLERFERSPLVWFVDRVAGSKPTTATATGILLHAVFESVEQLPALDLDAAIAMLEERWGELRFEADWLEVRERRRAERKLVGMLGYLSDFARSGRAVLGREERFELVIDVARVRGTIDRLESGSDGVRVVDLKTGSRIPTVAEAAEHLQLGVYQLGLQAGAVAAAAQGEDGAALLFIGTGTTGTGHQLRERAPLDDESATAVRERIVTAARGMASGEYAGEIVHDDRDPLGAYEYRVQLVRSVCE